MTRLDDDEKCEECSPKSETQAHFNYPDFLRYSDLEAGTIRLDHAIREETASRTLAEIERVRRKMLPRVRLVISSPGGGAYYALAIYDALMALRKSNIEVEAVVEGWAASAAGMIVLQAATTRKARGHARFLLHEPRRWVFWSVERTSDLEDEVKEMKALSDQICGILAERCGRTVQEVETLIQRREVWFSASEALEWGLIDEII